MIPKNASNQSPSRPFTFHPRTISEKKKYLILQVILQFDSEGVKFGRCKELYCYGVVFPSPQTLLPQQTSSSSQLCLRSPQRHNHFHLNHPRSQLQLEWIL